MQVNLNCNQPRPQFGMAFRRPSTSEMGVFTDTVIGNAGEYSAQILRRGLRQFDAEQAQLKRFDTRFNANEQAIEIIENATDKVIDKYGHFTYQTGLDVFGGIQYPGRKFFASIFNPKRLLPKEFHLAGEKAKQLEAEAIRKENLTQNLF